MTETIVRDKNMVLVTAVADRNAEVVIASLKNGANIHYNEDMPLRCAAYLGYVEIAELLLKNGANVHANGNEPLFTAIRARDRELIEMLLTRGASLQAVLDTKKDKLDKGSLELISEIQSRDTHDAAEKRRTELKEKARKAPRPIMKMRGP